MAYLDTAFGARLSPAAAAPATQPCPSLPSPTPLRSCCGWGQPRSDHVPKAKGDGGTKSVLPKRSVGRARTPMVPAQCTEARLNWQLEIAP